MLFSHIEEQYPINFRQREAEQLGTYLRSRQSVEIVGMKRIGISNFLRFFLYHKYVIPTYVDNQNTHLFIPIDLHDLVEVDLFAFWKLTLKRIIDRAGENKVSDSTLQILQKLFLTNIQTQDMFLSVDAVRQALLLLIGEGYVPTLFILRFDKLKEAVNEEFFANLQGLVDATEHQLAYVFTSYRSLTHLVPGVFTRQALASFSRTMFFRPAVKEDVETIFSVMKSKYQLEISEQLKKELMNVCDGHAQYLQLALIIFSELQQAGVKGNYLANIQTDERIILQSEEIYNSLSEDEQQALQQVVRRNAPLESKNEVNYLSQTGIVYEKSKKSFVFNVLFGNYVKAVIQKPNKKFNTQLTKKEQLLYEYLLMHKDEICERLDIQEHVWHEYEEIGVSDWTIDRLVSRLRKKLRQQNSHYTVLTIRSRGFLLTEQKLV